MTRPVPGVSWLAVARVTSLLCAGLLPACSKGPASEAELQRHSLPGFSIALLEGEVTSTSSSPSDGKHVIKLPRASAFEKVFGDPIDAGTMLIEWSSQTFSSDEWKTTLLPVILQTLDAETAKGNRLLKEATVGEGRWVYVIGTPRAPVGMGVINCDPGFSVDVTLAHYRDVDRQFEELSRIVKSVECAVTDANRVRPIAATRLPEKFGRTPDRDVQIYQSLDGEQVVINFTQSDVQRDPRMYRHLMRALLATAMGLEIPESQMELLPAGSPQPAGKSSLMRANFPATNETLYIGTQYCPTIGLSLISLWMAPEGTEQLARERQSQLGCPGEESSPSPAFASLADAACDAGEKQLCGLEEMPQ